MHDIPYTEDRLELLCAMRSATKYQLEITADQVMNVGFRKWDTKAVEENLLALQNQPEND